jgi:phosphate transport system protein
MPRILSLDGQMDSLNITLRNMCDRVMLGLETLLSHFQKPDDKSLIKAIVLDDEVDAMESLLDETILTILATQTPLASELRRVMACAKIAGYVERIGDSVKSLARQLVGRSGAPYQDRLGKMLEITLDLYQRTYKAMFYGDSSLIADIFVMDDAVDSFQKEILQCSRNMLANTPSKREIDYALQIGNIANKLEKIADLCCSWAKQIDFADHGNVRKKFTKPKHRVLILDNDHGVLAGIVANFIQKESSEVCSCGVVTKSHLGMENKDTFLNYVPLLSRLGIVPEIFPTVPLANATWNRVLLLITLGNVELSPSDLEAISFKVAKLHWPEIHSPHAVLETSMVELIQNRCQDISHLMARSGVAYANENRVSNRLPSPFPTASS